MNDTQMDVILSTGDPRKVAELILQRSGVITFHRRGDDKRAEQWARKKQKEVFQSKAAQDHLLKRESFCVEIRNHSQKSLRYGYLLAEIRKLDDVWYRDFSVFDKERHRMAKQLEIKGFLKRHRHRFRR